MGHCDFKSDLRIDKIFTKHSINDIGENMEKHPDITNTAHYKCLESVEKSQHDLYLCYCGIHDCLPDHVFGPYERTEYLIHIVISGKGTYRVGNKTYNLGPNSLFLIWPGVTTIYEADTTEPWSYIWFGFNGLKSESVLRYAGLSKDNPVATVPDIKPYKDAVIGILDS